MGVPSAYLVSLLIFFIICSKQSILNSDKDFIYEQMTPFLRSYKKGPRLLCSRNFLLDFGNLKHV